MKKQKAKSGKGKEFKAVCLSSDEESAEDEDSEYDGKEIESEDHAMTDLDSEVSGDENVSPPNAKVCRPLFGPLINVWQSAFSYMAYGKSIWSHSAVHTPGQMCLVSSSVLISYTDNWCVKTCQGNRLSIEEMVQHFFVGLVVLM